MKGFGVRFPDGTVLNSSKFLESENFKIDVNGKLGIGTSDPSTPLDVISKEDPTSPVLKIENATGSFQLFRVSGSPEGVVVGNIGDLANDTVNGVLYIKTGSPGTDTGWSSVSSGGGGGGGSAAGSSGAVQFNSASSPGDFAADSANLIWNDSTNRLGIGTNSPSSALHVDSNAINSTPVLTIENTGGNFQIFRVDTNPEGILTGSRGDLAIDTVGGLIYIKNVGDSNNTGWVSLTSSGGGSGGGGGTPAGTAGAIQFNSSPIGSFEADSNNLIWDNALNSLGIGTNGPNSTLHVDSNAANSTPIITVENTAGNFQIFRVDTAPNVATGAVGDIANDTASGIVYLKTGTGWVPLASGIGNTGSLAFWNSSATLSQNANLVWNSVLNRLGVGTNNPETALHISTNAVKTTPILRLQNNTGDFQIFGSDGTPETNITGSVGDLTVDYSNGLLYIKSTGVGTSTGWTVLSGGGSGSSGLVDGPDHGDVTISGGGTIFNLKPDVVGTPEIANEAVTLAKIEQVASSTILGRVTSGTGTLESLSGTQVTDLLPAYSGTTSKGLVPPASSAPASATKYLTETGTWATVATATVPVYNSGGTGASGLVPAGTTPLGKKYLRDDAQWVNTFIIGNGTLGSLAIAFDSSSTTGVYRPAADIFGIAASGSLVASFATASSSISGGLTGSTLDLFAQASTTGTKTINVGTGATGGTTAVSIATGLITPVISTVDIGSTLSTTTIKGTLALGESTKTTTIKGSVLTIGEITTSTRIYSSSSLNIEGPTASNSTLNLFAQSNANAVTKTINIGTAGAVGSITTVNIGNDTTGASTIEMGVNSATVTIKGANTTLTGAAFGTATLDLFTQGTASGAIKNINIGTGANTGSTTNITIGSSSTTTNLVINGSSVNKSATDLFLDALGTTQGSIIYRDNNTNKWQVLAPGNSTQYLKSGGAGANPMWDTPTASIAIGSAVGNSPNTNSVLFINSSNQLSQNTNFVFNTTRLGIGTATPGTNIPGINIYSSVSSTDKDFIKIESTTSDVYIDCLAPGGGLAAPIYAGLKLRSSSSTGYIRYFSAANKFEFLANSTAPSFTIGTNNNVSNKFTVFPAVSGSFPSLRFELSSAAPSTITAGDMWATSTGLFFSSAGGASSGKQLAFADGTGATGSWGINITGSAGRVINTLTFSNAGSGASSDSTFNGSAARTISYNSIGAPSTTGSGASGSWAIDITGVATFVKLLSDTSTSEIDERHITFISGNTNGNSYSIRADSGLKFFPGTNQVRIKQNGLLTGANDTATGKDGDGDYGRVGLSIERTTNTNRWNITINHNNVLVFSYNSVYKAFISNAGGTGGGGGELDFTGQHRSRPASENNASMYETGLIVISNGTYSGFDGYNSISINEAIPKIKLSSRRNEKTVFGVISDKEDDSSLSREYALGHFVSAYIKQPGDNRFIINSLGEGGIWVCNINGNLENGDYITSCEIPGYGMRQDDDLLHNYTVAKITCDCNFDLDSPIYMCEEFEFEGQTYKKAFVGCTYHCG